MAEESPNLSRPPTSGEPPGRGPLARLELRHGTARPLLYEVFEAGFLIGSVPGCDLRLPGADLPPLLCLIAPRPGGLGIRKLVPTYPIARNGQPLSGSLLADGDRITLGPAELLIHLPQTTAGPADESLVGTNAAALAAFREELEGRARALDERQRRLEEQTGELETDRIIWYQRREEIEREARLVQEQRQDLARRRADQERREEELHRQRQDLETQRGELTAREQEIQSWRQQLADLQRQFYQRYRERRDRLAGLQEAVAVAARKVQEQKHQLEAETRQIALQRAEVDERRRELGEREFAFRTEAEHRTAALDEARRQHEEEHRQRENHIRELQKEFEERLAQCDLRERRLQEECQVLEGQQAQYQADLVRLHRQAAHLDERQRQLEERGLEADRRLDQLDQESRELQDQARQLAAWRGEVQAQAEQLLKDRADLELHKADVARRVASLDDQQTALAALRTRWERRAEQLRQEEEDLVGRRARLEAVEADLRHGNQELLRRREELTAAERAFAEEDRRLAEDRAAVAAALVHLGEWQDCWAAQDEQLRLRTADLDRQAAQLAEEAAQLQTRSAQVRELQDRLGAERQALREREAALAQAEMGQEALQEQLRRRSDELAERQRALGDRERLHAEAQAGEQARREEWERARQQAEEQLAARHQELEQRAAVVAQSEAAARQREADWQHHHERLKQSGRAVAAARKQLHDQRAAWAAKQRQAVAALAGLRADWEALRREAAELEAQLPGWEVHSRTAAEHLQRARDQLRGHLGELHAYARQAREDLEALRSQVQDEAEKVSQQGLLLHRARDEHRLAVTAFRQQLIDWQGQVAEMKRSLSQDQSRLARRHAEVEATSARLAERAEQLQVQEREVTERRDEMARHLAEMREWYRRKLRELTGRFGDGTPAQVAPEGGAPEGETAAAGGILALTGDVDAGDRRLGELLRSLELVDADTLAALLVEARKQRQSLRQVLLASGYVTLYQMALIEAGNLDGLMLGPVRVMDRLRLAARETVYRVFDPRRGPEAVGGGEGYAVLRHLAEAEMEDAVRPDEFRQRFAAAALLRHPNLAATFEVLEIHGRPAVLQEWVNGLPAGDWPPLGAVPGVWFRLVRQAALGLHAAHAAGLVHGHLHPSLLVLTGEGVLKVCGLGEPLWLAEPETAAPGREPTALDDLAGLGGLAREWAAAVAGRRKGGRPLVAPLQTILERFQADAAEQRYPDVAALLEDLDRVSGDVPANPEAWDRLLRHIRENARADPFWRQSA